MDNKHLTPEQFAQWTAALRSGRYKQGKKRLRTSDNTYCCLGVANEELNLGCPSDGSYMFTDQFEYAYLTSDHQHVLGTKNDSLRWNFNQIADYIDNVIAPKYAKEQSNV